MLHSIHRYVSERRRSIIHSALFLCGSYTLCAYVSARVEEMKDRVHRNNAARDNLRRRFQSTHDDVLENMDVEALTHELQSVSRDSRTKSQLWNEVKILALTRTLTTMYIVTLLSLLTAVQLNILGRSRYIHSVRISDREERGDDGDLCDQIAEETELRFLTLSWWLLHVGWKDIAARVRGSVESVFDNVSLKAKISSSELFSLIMDVRRCVETDGSGSKLGARFLSPLLPPTPETTVHVLEQGGALSVPRPCLELPTKLPDPFATSYDTLDVDPKFNALLTETRSYLAGADFIYALGCALDRATEVLMDGLRARVFVDTASTVNVVNALAQSTTGGTDACANSEKKGEVKVRLAGLLPGLARWCQLALNSTPNELVDNIMAVREVSALEAIVMSDYEEILLVSE